MCALVAADTKEAGSRARHTQGARHETGREHAERLASTMLGAEASEKSLAAGVLLGEEHGCLAEGPREVGVADLGAGGGPRREVPPVA